MQNELLCSGVCSAIVHVLLECSEQQTERQRAAGDAALVEDMEIEALQLAVAASWGRMALHPQTVQACGTQPPSQLPRPPQ